MGDNSANGKIKKFDWLIFLLISLSYCLALSFRKIPYLDSDNDTGRYVYLLKNFCSGDDVLTEGDRGLSFLVFFGTTSISCVTEMVGTFLFQVAMFVPITFLLFSRWRQGTYIWAVGMLFSVYGLELATNAMRQNLGLCIFLCAIALTERSRWKSIAIFGLASVAHSSVVYYLPFGIYLLIKNFKKNIHFYISIFFVVIGSILLTIAYSNELAKIIDDSTAAATNFGLIYDLDVSLSYLFFMIAPLYFIFGMRLIYEREHMHPYEIPAVIYSTLLLLLSYIFFPYITYRFAVSSVAIQIFIVTLSGKFTKKVATTVSLALFLHLLFMFMVSSHFHPF